MPITLAIGTDPHSIPKENRLPRPITRQSQASPRRPDFGTRWFACERLAATAANHVNVGRNDSNAVGGETDPNGPDCSDLFIVTGECSVTTADQCTEDADCPAGETCTGAELSVTVDHSAVNLFGGLAAGEMVQCFYTNTEWGQIIIERQPHSEGDPATFDFTLTSGPCELNQSFQLADQAAPHGSGTLLPGGSVIPIRHAFNAFAVYEKFELPLCDKSGSH